VSWRHRIALLLAVVLGAAVRLVWMPLSRHRFDGHEREYLDAFQGHDWQGSTHLVPTLAGLYQALGTLSDDPRLLLGVNLAVGIGAVALAGLLGWRRWGPTAGVVLAVGLAISPEWAFWSASAYNVNLPLTLVLAGLAVGPREDATWLPQGSWWGIPLVALGCSMRMELALLAPAMVWIGGWKPTLGVLGSLAMVPVLDTAPALHPVLQVWPANLRLGRYLGPLGGPAVLLLAVVVDKRSLPLALAALWVHAVGAAFDDYGSRHGLLGGLALLAVVATARDWRRLAWAPAAVWLAVGTGVMAHWFYARVPTYRADLPDLPTLDEPGCTELMDDPVHERSHWDQWESWPDDACWGEEFIHRSWTSRGLQDRALRMRVLYGAEPVGVWELDGGPRVFYALERPWRL
jgi:hypothetical protein